MLNQQFKIINLEASIRSALSCGKLREAEGLLGEYYAELCNEYGELTSNKRVFERYLPFVPLGTLEEEILSIESDIEECCGFLEGAQTLTEKLKWAIPLK